MKINCVHYYISVVYRAKIYDYCDFLGFGNPHNNNSAVFAELLLFVDFDNLH